MGVGVEVGMAAEAEVRVVERVVEGVERVGGKGSEEAVVVVEVVVVAARGGTAAQASSR